MNILFYHLTVMRFERKVFSDRCDADTLFILVAAKLLCLRGFIEVLYVLYGPGFRKEKKKNQGLQGTPGVYLLPQPQNERSNKKWCDVGLHG